MVDIRFSGSALEVMAEVVAFASQLVKDDAVQESARDALRPNQAVATPEIPPEPKAIVPEPETAPPEKPKTRKSKPEAPKPLTDEEVRAAGRSAAGKFGSEAVRAILLELGAPNMTALTADQRPVFIAKLNELGGTNA